MHAPSRFGLLLGLVLVLACASSQDSPQSAVELLPPEVFVTGLVPVGGGLFEQRVRIDLRIANPNDVALDLSGLSFSLDVNGNELARGMSSEDLSVPRLGESLVSVEASTTLMGVLDQVVRMAEQRALAYELRGLAHLRDSVSPALPFQRSANLKP